MMEEVLRIGNITRSKWPGSKGQSLNRLYIGNGRMGCCLDPYGLMNQPFNTEGAWSSSNTALHHADHWTRGAYGLDFYLPVAQLKWADGRPRTPVYYAQSLELYDATLHTMLGFGSCELEMTTWFSQANKDILAIEFDYAGDMQALPTICLQPMTSYATAYEYPVSGTAEESTLSSDGTAWSCRLKAGTADTLIHVRLHRLSGDAQLTQEGDGMGIRFGGQRGHFVLLIGVAKYARKQELQEALDGIGDIGAYRQAARQSWHKRWGDAYVRVADPDVQAMWARSLYYTLCTYSGDRHSPPSPTGWTGNGWAFHFPQDISYILPALLRLGHVDIAQAIVEFYHSMLEDMRAYTKRIYDAKGAMWAWEFPIGPDTRLLEDEFPNWYQFEIHNAAYPAKMAYEASLFLKDDAWSSNVAWPIVADAARFYLSKMKKNDEGTWSLHVTPSMGQDEFGGHNRANFLCSLFSAQYCLQTALKMVQALGMELPEAADMQAVLYDGLAYHRLYNEELGIYNTFETDRQDGDFGRQKHPVQLNPLVFLPLGDKPDKYAIRAYRMRSDLCSAIRDNHSDGWTLPDYWLASFHLGDERGLYSYWNKVRDMHYADEDLIQLYESSSNWGMPFYTTSHGLFLQAVNDAVVSDYWGTVQIGAACPPQWGRVEFRNLRTATGEVISGVRRNDRWEVE